MNRARAMRLTGWGFGAALVLGGAWWWYASFATRRDLLDQDITWYRDELRRMDADLAEQGRVKKRLAELAGGSLGVTEETVSASLRSALNAIAQECGLAAPSVTTRDAEGVKNPSTQGTMTAAEFQRGLPRGLRDRADFWAMSATLQGTGTLEQAMRALVTVQSQPWASRIDGVSLTPTGSGKNRGERVSLTIRLTTVFVPDVAHKPPTALVSAPSPEALERARFLVSKNVFREPAAVAAAPPPAEPTPPAPGPVGPAYGEWRVTGVVRGVGGPELWLLNERTRQTVMLGVGQGVMDAVFVGSLGEIARIRIGEQEYEVALAQTLQDRKVVSR